MSSLVTYPTEILLLVARKLPIQDLVSFMRTCHRLYGVGRIAPQWALGADLLDQANGFDRCGMNGRRIRDCNCPNDNGHPDDPRGRTAARTFSILDSYEQCRLLAQFHLQCIRNVTRLLCVPTDEDGGGTARRSPQRNSDPRIAAISALPLARQSILIDVASLIIADYDLGCNIQPSWYRRTFLGHDKFLKLHSADYALALSCILVQSCSAAYAPGSDEHLCALAEIRGTAADSALFGQRLADTLDCTGAARNFY